MSHVTTNRASAGLDRDGFILHESPLVPPDLIERASDAMDAVIAGEYETGIAPMGRNFAPGEGAGKLAKIDDAHPSNGAIHALLSHPAIGAWAAELTGANFIQLWASQLLVKPPVRDGSGGAGASAGGNVGWHQDQEYWSTWWEGEVFTVWLAISDVRAESGPMRFVRGSHRWGLLAAGDFFGNNLDALKQRIQSKYDGPWEEIPAILPPGGASLHHRLTVHGSGPNVSPSPRKSFALHLRTEKSRPAPNATHVYTQTDDPRRSPILYERKS